MKKSMIALLAGASMIAVAGAAGAATVEINGYGASAQYDFWVATSGTYLSSVAGCTITKFGKSSDNKYLDVVATNCQTPPTGLSVGDNIIFRYASKASYSGIWAMQGHADTSDKGLSPTPFTTGPVAPATSYAVTCQDALNGGQSGQFRWFGDDSSFTGGTPSAPATITGGICLPVNLAASDVEATAFLQSSIGQKLGPMGGGSVTKTYTGADKPSDSSPNTLTPGQPIIVPFGFFVNKAVAYNKCVGGANAGTLCSKDSDCSSSVCRATSDGAVMASDCSNANTIGSITRTQAVAIFSGAAKNWSDFGGYFASQPIVSCLRHAGSGTHASIDLEVMHSSWGANISGAQKLPKSGNDYGAGVYVTAINPASPNTSADYVVWFNDGTSDELNCIKGASAASIWTGGTAHSSSCIGAIGYMDADKACSLPANVAAVSYAGNLPTRENIRNGRYDFFSNEWMYWNPNAGVTNPSSGNVTSGAQSAGVANGLYGYASIPTNLTATTIGACRNGYWNARNEMFFNRAATNAPVLKVGTTGSHVSNP